MEYSSTRVHVDANAAIDYVRESVLHDLDLPPTGHKPDVLRKRLKEIPRVYIAKTACGEVQRNLRKDIAKKLGSTMINKVTGIAQNLIHEYVLSAECSDYLGYVCVAQEIYTRISGDPSNQNFSKWRMKKRKFVVSPVLGSKNDL